MKQITEIDDPRLVKGLAHPLRIQILRVLQGRVASPSEIAEEIEAPLGNVSYHVRFLARVGLIELAGTEPRRGAVEHYYRAVGRAQMVEQAWGQVPKVVKDAMIGSTLQRTGQMVAAAAHEGGFDRDQVHVSHNSYALDERGFAELAAAVARLQSDVDKIVRASGKRIASGKNTGPAIDAGVVLMVFEGSVPEASSQDGAAPRRRSAAGTKRRGTGRG